MTKQARVGSLVEIQIPNGLGIKNGKVFQEYKTVRARVHLVMPEHLVCVVGKRFGHPYCAESHKLIRW
jgi:hypothetical protein